MNANLIFEAVKQAGVTPDKVYLCLRSNAQKVTSRWHNRLTWRDGVREMFVQAEAAENATIELNLLHSSTETGIGDLPGNRFRGLKGIEFKFKGKSSTFGPTEMIARNIGFDRAWNIFVEENRLEENSVKETVKVRVYEAVQYLASFGRNAKLTQIFRGNEIRNLSSVNAATCDRMTRMMAERMAKFVHEDGRLTYSYWPSRGTEGRGNNMIRQFMGTLCLFKMADFYSSPVYRQLAEHNLKFNINNYCRRERDLGLVYEGEKVKLGAIALAGLAVMESAEKKYLPQLFAATQHLWQNDGAFRTFYAPADRNDNQNFYPGEALLFWVSYYLNAPDPALLEKIEKSFFHYRDWHRKDPNPAFVPWHTQAYYLLWRHAGGDHYRDFIFEMNDWLLPVQQWETAKSPDVQGQFYDPLRPFGPPHASSTGVYLEGLIDAYELAEICQDEGRMARYGQTILRGIRSTMQLQFVDDIDMFYISRKNMVRGGIRTTVYDNVIRIDNIQHNLMAMMKIMKSSLFARQSSLAGVS